MDTAKRGNMFTMNQEMNGKRSGMQTIMVMGILAIGFLVCAVPVAAYYPTGGIQIWSTPGGAYACVDGNNCQYTASDGSAYFDGIAGGMYHSVTVSKNGYETFSQSVEVDPQVTSVVDADLVQYRVRPVTYTVSSDPGIIQVFVSPYGGTTCLDDGQCQSFSPIDYNGVASVQFNNLQPNRYYTLTTRMSGFQTFSQNIYVTPGDYETINVNMQSLHG